MLVRVIDYVGNLGGGVRFVGEMLSVLAEKHAEATFEFVSYGGASDRYRQLLINKDITCRVLDIPPAKVWQNEQWKIIGLPGTERITRRLGFGTKWHYDVTKEAFHDCDVAWFPWIHRHRIPDANAARTIGSFHDAIFFQFEGLLPENVLKSERVTTLSWLSSSAHICVSSHATVSTMMQLFGVRGERFSVIPLAGDHAHSPEVAIPPASWSWTLKPFLLCPANTFPHKNHDTLLAGVADWGATYPLVLTGSGTDLKDRGRGQALRQLALGKGLGIGSSLIPLGYVSDDLYYSLLSRAWALVMPTLAEGGGSFPVWEALLQGIPVLCSDIPVLREQLDRIGGDVLWFDPRSADDLSHQLNNLEQNYPLYKQRAEQQVPRLRHRSWETVADEYWSIFESIRAESQE